jgi:arsenite methyltransferase
MEEEELGKAVRERYGNIAKQSSSCCGPAKSCCGSTNSAQAISRGIGYTEEELKAVPEGANLGLGCGNPVALASLKEGEVVLDLGSGAGFDCFLAAKQVGSTGKVIGVDMTAEMLERARQNARKGDFRNVEFRLGEIENLPAGDNQVDIIISNCVINLSPNKKRVFQEAFRVLRPGGRLMVSDIVLLRELPSFIRDSIEAYIGCVAGAMKKEEYLRAIEDAGFEDIKVMGESSFSVDLIVSDPTMNEVIKKTGLPSERLPDIAGSVVSMKVSGAKPAP